jgi:hypothetical protein
VVVHNSAYFILVYTLCFKYTENVSLSKFCCNMRYNVEGSSRCNVCPITTGIKQRQSPTRANPRTPACTGMHSSCLTYLLFIDSLLLRLRAELKSPSSFRSADLRSPPPSTISRGSPCSLHVFARHPLITSLNFTFPFA